jgi:hypothetical protein
MGVVPKHKGVGLLAVVEGLKANPRAQQHVPESLRHYLSDPILPSGWYPEADYNVLIEALALGVERRVPGRDVWVSFGRLAAQRDIAGEQGEMPLRSRVKNPGVYRNFRDNQPSDIAEVFQRIGRLWRLYHDTGHFTVKRAENDPCTVVLRLLNFHFPVRGLIDLQTGYLVEYARLLGLRLESRVSRAVTSGDLFCEWRCSVERSPQHTAALSSLPAEGP